MEKNRILITGKTGTVGSNLEFGDESSYCKVDLRDFKATLKWIEDAQPEAIVHCAARVPSVNITQSERYSFFYDNLLINSNVLEAARLCSIPRVLSLLSTWMLNNETLVNSSRPLGLYFPYGYSKVILEHHSRMCFEFYGLKYNSILPTNIYGINDNFSLKNGHVIATLIHKAHLAKVDDTDFVAWGDGEQQREFLFTSDLSNIIKWVLENYLDKESLIVSNHASISIKQIAVIIANYMGVSDRLKFDEDKPIGKKFLNTSDDKLDRLHKFNFTPIEDGIAATIDWFLARYPNVRL